MTAPTSAAVAVRTLMAVFGCMGIFAFTYIFAVDRYASCFEAHNRWLMALNVDFYINVAVIAAWVIYKESSWITATIVTVLLIVFGSIATSGYVLMQLFKLSEFGLLVLSFHLLRTESTARDATGQRRGVSVVTARVIFSAVGCLMLGTFIYLLIVVGSPFDARVFTRRCMIGTLTDFYANIAVLSVWIAYKESSWISAFFWILLLICFGGVTTCAYIVQQAFYLSPQQPISLIIFNRRNRNLLSEPLLIAHGYV
ncbi:hypothetical protein L1987_02098 [Smallanthus sonchifolius]|uniref:Uncharacterized protein n=1 Tax=Smallanthus sonchifolius TaxID=185202 RepID=A0ACB9K709_9ASTR|nr:hypothetical protein L1987_02098 [Smallanthus sonchifolius]